MKLSMSFDALTGRQPIKESPTQQTLPTSTLRRPFGLPSFGSVPSHCVYLLWYKIPALHYLVFPWSAAAAAAASSHQLRSWSSMINIGIPRFQQSLSLRAIFFFPRSIHRSVGLCLSVSALRSFNCPASLLSRVSDCSEQPGSHTPKSEFCKAQLFSTRVIIHA